MDGWITIGTDLETKKFDKKYNALKTRLENEEIKLEIKSGDVENAKQELAETTKELNNISKQREKINKTIEETQKEYNKLNEKISTTGSATPGEYLKHERLSTELLNLKEQQSKINNEYDKYNAKIEKSYDNLTKAESKYEIQNNKVQQLRGEFELLNDEMKKNNVVSLSKMKDSVDSIGNSIQKVTRKIVKWGLAIFSIRSMYMLIRQSMSTLSQYDDQMTTDIEYMRYAIATALKPIIETVLNLVKQLLFYVNYLAKAWFNVDLFAKASSKEFAKSNKQAKALSKTLASFDEMNILSDNSSNSDTVTGIPSFDLTDTQGMKIPKWLEWIKDHGKEIAAAIALIIGSKFLNTGLLGLTGLASSLAQIGIIAIGVDLFYKALTGRDLIEDLKDIYNGIKEIVGAKNDDYKMNQKSHQKAKEYIEDKKQEAEAYNKNSKEIENYIDWLTLNIEQSKYFIENTKGNIDVVNKEKDTMENLIKSYTQLYSQGKLNNAQIQEYTKFMADLGLKTDGTKMSTEEFSYYLKNIKPQLEENQRKINNMSGATEALGTSLSSLTRQHYLINIDSKLNEPDTTLFKSSLNKLLEKLGTNIASVTAISGAAMGAIRIPKLAVGGIINNPGRGVPVGYGKAIGGEAGAEWIQPLTDSQSLDRVADAIGSRITIELTNITELDGRQIARKVDKIQQNNNFVFNR